MPAALIRFLDGELLHAEVEDLSLDQALLEVEVSGADPNNQRALLPLSAIRQVLVGAPEPVPDDLQRWDRAAFHFIDGQVMRAWIDPNSRLGRFGGVWRVAEPGGRETRTLAIPYSSLKGVFKLRQWDSRPLSERAGGEPRLGPVARILAERDSTAAAESRRRLSPRSRP
jgi:hypothetical protein